MNILLISTVTIANACLGPACNLFAEPRRLVFRITHCESVQTAVVSVSLPASMESSVMYIGKCKASVRVFFEFEETMIFPNK